jgi:hypothetical protein
MSEVPLTFYTFFAPPMIVPAGVQPGVHVLLLRPALLCVHLQVRGAWRAWVLVCMVLCMSYHPPNMRLLLRLIHPAWEALAYARTDMVVANALGTDVSASESFWFPQRQTDRQIRANGKRQQGLSMLYSHTL